MSNVKLNEEMLAALKLTTETVALHTGSGANYSGIDYPQHPNGDVDYEAVVAKGRAVVANANVYATAPAMLDFLIRLKAFADARHPLQWHAQAKDDNDDETTVSEELFDLIAKATGKN